MGIAFFGIIVGAGLLIGTLVLLEVGSRIGARRLAADLEGARAGQGVVEAAIFALMGLLIAFTFSGAASRLDTRRLLVVEEANAVGTAYLRLDLLPGSAQPALRDLFRRYVDSRLEVYRRLPDASAALAELERSQSLQGEIWAGSVAACRADEKAPTCMLLLPAVNEMIDVTTRRTTALRTHPPTIIFGMLWGLILASALIAGYAMAGGKSRSWVHAAVFALVLSGTAYVIWDLEYPRRGFIRVDAADQLLRDVRNGMK